MIKSLQSNNSNKKGGELSTAQHALLTELSSIVRAAGLATAVACAAIPFGAAQPAQTNLPAAEDWAWSQISQGLPADFNGHYGDLDPKSEEDPAWLDPRLCRTLSASFLVGLFTKPEFHDAITYRGVEIHGAKILGDVDLNFAKIDKPLQDQNNQFKGAILLSKAHAESPIDFGGSLVSGVFAAYGFRSESSLGLFGANLKSGLDVRVASIWDLDLGAATCGGNLNAVSLQVGQDLFMRSAGGNKASFKNVRLAGAKIGGQLVMVGASFEGELAADSVQVGGSLLMRSEGGNKTSFKNVILRGAKITGQIDMTGASFEGELAAESLQVGQDLGMIKASFKNVSLLGAKIAGQLNMTNASFDGELAADSVQVGGSLLMRSEGGNKASFKDVGLAGVKIGGQLDMDGASFDGVLNVEDLQVGQGLFMRSVDGSKASFKNVILRGAKIGQVSMIGASFEGELNADSLQVGQSLLMRSEGGNKTSFKNVRLAGAKIGGQIDMTGASFEGELNADSLQVGQSLLMLSGGGNQASFKNVILRGAKIGGQLVMDGASFDGALDADSVQVGGSLLMRSEGGGNKASFKVVILSGSKITGQVSMDGARFEGVLKADDLQVGQGLFMRSVDRSKASFKAVDLHTASISGWLMMDGAVFGGKVDAQALHVGGDASMRDIYTDAAIALRFAQLGGNLDLSGAELATLDLRGAAIVGEMRLGDRDSVVHWAASRDGANSIDLDLRNAHVGSLSDNKDSWPTHLRLDGFTFARLGGFQGESSGEMVEQRGADWWDRNFARRDDFHPSPYEQLARVFAAAGERDAADEIRYDEQVRADESISWADPIHVWRWLLRSGTGYGIGSYMFRALYCAVGLSITGAIFLRCYANRGLSNSSTVFSGASARASTGCCRYSA